MVDVVLLVCVVVELCFKLLIFILCGGGIGINGQVLNGGIIVDMFCYMNCIIEINFDEGWVCVEIGVIKDQLNQFFKFYGYFFVFELFISNCVMLGGMINIDVFGQGLLVYGKMLDYVFGLWVVLMGGDIFDIQVVLVVLVEMLGNIFLMVGWIYNMVYQCCKVQCDLIIDKFFKFNCFFIGYDLCYVFNDEMSEFDLICILIGLEGMLVFIIEVWLDIICLLKVCCLVNVKYDFFDFVLCNVFFMVEVKVLLVEIVDFKVFNLVCEDIVWYLVSELIIDVLDKEMFGFNIVEFVGDDVVLIDQQVIILCQWLDELMVVSEVGVIGWQVCYDFEGVECIYVMCKKVVGLLGNVKGVVKFIFFVEDICVLFEYLVDYIVEFCVLFDSYGLSYGMFGYVDVGVLYVCLVLDMCDLQQEVLMKQIFDDVVVLMVKYGGLLWGEYGKGFCVEYSLVFFGEMLYVELCKIKVVFDFDNCLNLGKICFLEGIDVLMMKVDVVKCGIWDWQIFIVVCSSWCGVMECNGNGLCFNFDVKSLMCLLMKVSNQCIYLLKGWVMLVWEWLCLLVDCGVDFNQLEKVLLEQGVSLCLLVVCMCNSWYVCKGEYDFLYEVKEVMFGCLVCKVCLIQCLIKIDVFEFCLCFLQLYYSCYLWLVCDYLVVLVEFYVLLMVQVLKIFNFFINQFWLKKLLEKYIGMVDLLLFLVLLLKQQMVGYCFVNMIFEQFEVLSVEQKVKMVLVVQDFFISYYDVQVVVDFICLVEVLGYQLVFLLFLLNGKVQYIKGFFICFVCIVQKMVDFFNCVVQLGMLLVGVDLVLVFCYCDEYKQMFGDKCGDFQVLLVYEWLLKVLISDVCFDLGGEFWYLFGYCIEVIVLLVVIKQWVDIFVYFGVKLENVSVGCCGMVGIYGYEVKNYVNLLVIYVFFWQQVMQWLL